MVNKNFKLALEVAKKVQQENGRALIVGGFVRDHLLKLPSKDIDLEVYGIEFEKLKKILKSLGKIGLVGESFAVFKLGDMDISIPRRDNKVGKGHKGFEIESDPSMTFREASSRRDFTINALALDPLTKEILDEHGGKKDLKQKVLRAVDKKTFGDDPLRVLRAMQFASRFGFEIEEKTKKMCQKMELDELSKDRIGEEWKKMFLRSPRPSEGMELARELRIIEKLHPELEALFDTPQEKKWHPEGTVWEHTKLAVDLATKIAKKNKLIEVEIEVLLFAVLCHDMGKPPMTKIENGRIRSKGHDRVGAEIARKFLRGINVSQSVISKVQPLIREHQFFRVPEFTDKAVRKLSVRLKPANILQLVMVMEADLSARGEKSRDFHEGKEILKKAKKLKVMTVPPKPLVTGDDLIKLGYKEGSKLGKILKKFYLMQLDGEISTKKQGLKTLEKKNGNR